MNLGAAVPSRSINKAPRARALVGSTVRPLDAQNKLVQSAQKPFAQRVDDVLVELKSAASQYAMYLSPEQRETIFDQLENIINVDDWYEEDEFPRLNAFKDLLAWSIYAELPQWHSLGVDDDGDVLIAWHTKELTLTANFDGNRLVRWTSRYQGEGEAVAHAAGDCSLRQFAKQAKFYLQGEATDGL
jgi:hypothetical protein